MSTSTTAVQIPPWDLADRLRKALRVADIGVQEMADYLGVSRNTVSAWINGRTPPSTQSIRLWALRTGLPYEWLRHGEAESEPPHPPHGDIGWPDSKPATRSDQPPVYTVINPVQILRPARLQKIPA